MSIEDNISSLIDETTKENNEAEKTISLQLLGLAVFLLTVIGAFVVADNSVIQPDLVIKVFILINIIFLFLSLAMGIFHLLITKLMWLKLYNRAILAWKVIGEIAGPDEKTKVLSKILTQDIKTTMAFFYLQIGFLGLGFTVFIGLIIAILF